MKKLILVLPMIALFGCKIVSCPTADRIATGGAAAIAKAADCKNVQAIREDLTKFLGGEACNKPEQTGPIAMIACPILGKLAADAMVKAIPAKWECSGGNAKLAVQGVLTTGCNLIPF